MSNATGNPLPTTDQTASTADQTVGNIVSSTESPIDSAIIAAVPALATPVLKQIWEGVLHVLFIQIGNFLGEFTGFVVIDVQQYIALKKAVSAQLAFNQAIASGNTDAINQASDALDQAVAPVLHYIGSVNPK